MELLKKAIELDPDFSSAYAQLGLLLSSGGTFISTSAVLNTREVWNVAKPYFIKALELNPDNGEAHNVIMHGRYYGLNGTLKLLTKSIGKPGVYFLITAGQIT